MHPLYRSISRWLLLVMLTTVLSPSFGWEAGQVAALEQNEAVHAGHEMMSDMMQHDGHDMAMADPACDGCPDHDKTANCAETQHQCCPGYVLGHLPGSLSGQLTLATPEADAAAVDGKKTRFSSRIPDGLERPPRASAA